MSAVPPTLLSIIESLQKLPPSKWHWDIHHLAATLKITVEQLHSFVKRIESGGSGKKSDDSWEPNPAPFHTPIKLTENQNDNVINLHYIIDSGRKGSLTLSLNILVIKYVMAIKITTIMTTTTYAARCIRMISYLAPP